MKGVEVSKFEGQKCYLKRYPHAETAQFKVFGSGYINERLVPEVLSADVPKVISHGRTSYEEFAYIEIINGRSVFAKNLTHLEAQACGLMLGKINRQHGHWFGSLDGKYTYASWRESWIPRWKVMVRLLEGKDRHLSEETDSWGTSMLARIDENFSPFLVHGDYGPGNLIWPPDRSEPMVIDWEHARFGHPGEDWAKIFLAEIFPEANGFSSVGQSVARSAWKGWVNACGNNSIREIFTEETLTLFIAYFAGTLGVFLNGSGEGRIKLLRRLVAGDNGFARELMHVVRS